MLKKKEICADYSSKINSNCEKQIILLTIPNDGKEGWYYLAVKKKTICITERNNFKT